MTRLFAITAMLVLLVVGGCAKRRYIATATDQSSQVVAAMRARPQASNNNVRRDAGRLNRKAAEPRSESPSAAAFGSEREGAGALLPGRDKTGRHEEELSDLPPVADADRPIPTVQDGQAVSGTGSDANVRRNGQAWQPRPLGFFLVAAVVASIVATLAWRSSRRRIAH